MNPIWTTITCPVYGNIGSALRDQVRQHSQPWKTHALLCLDFELLTATRTCIIVGIDEQLGLVASTWISLPDRIVLSGWKTCAFIFNVHVLAKCRGRGLGKHVVRLACSIAESNGADYVLLATKQSDLKLNFYSKLGFKAVPYDSWLMSYECKQPREQETKSKMVTYQEVMRTASPHDLATVQSICAQQHWFFENNSINISDPTECEEDFSTLLINKPVFDQFLLRGLYHGREFISWASYADNDELIHRILCDYKNEKELINLSNKLEIIIENIKIQSHLQLHKLKPRKLLNLK